MIKAFFVSFLIGILFLIAYTTDIFALFSHKAIAYGSFGLMIIMLAAARIILGNPLDKDKKDDKGDD